MKNILLPILLSFWGCSNSTKELLYDGPTPIDSRTTDNIGFDNHIIDDLEGRPSCPRGQGWTNDFKGCEQFQTSDPINELISFQNGKQKLVGTVTKPKTDKIDVFPAIILIHGSGPNDRDATSIGALGFQFAKEKKPFKDIAEYFAKHGYLVLRYDKRTCIVLNNSNCTSTKIEDIDTITIDTFIDDVSKGLDYLKSRKDVRTNDLIIAGHSQGGPMVLTLGKARSDITSIIVLAGGATSLRVVILDQYLQIIKWLKEKPSTPQVDKQIADIQAEHDKYDQALTQIDNGTYPGDTFKGSPVAFWKSWIDNHKDIKNNIQNLKQPIAAVSGTEDYNIPPKHTNLLAQWRGKLEKDFFFVYQGLTHPLIKYFPTTNSMEDHVDAKLLSDLKDWLNNQKTN